MTVNTVGDIIQSGSLNINGLATFSAGNSHNITLSNPSNTLNQISITSGNNASISSNTNLQIASTTLANNLNITTQGALNQTGSLQSDSLTLTAVNGINLTNTNQTHALNAVDTSGNISFNNAVDPLTISGITLHGNGSVNINNIGQINITGPIATTGGSVSIMTTSASHSPAPVITSAPISTQGNNIYINAANPTNINPILTVNSLLTTAGGTGQGVLLVGDNVALNVAPQLGAGNITLQGLPPAPPCA